LAISVAGFSDDALDDVHTILIHLREKVPGSSIHRSAVSRGVSNENLWHDAGFISGVRAIAANKLTDMRRAATRRRQPRFRRPNGPIVGPEVWRRYPPFFIIVSADTVAEREPLVSAGPEIPDTDQASPSDTVEQDESDQHARQIVGATLRGLRHSDIETLDFALLLYTPLVHGNRVDEALAAHLSQKGPRAITRDAARRRLTDARIRLEDAIVGQHREVLLGTLQHIPTHELGHQLRSALLAYLTMVGTRPREVVMDTALRTLRATVDPNGLTWPNRPTLASAVAAGLRQLYARHQALWGEPFFAQPEESHPSRGVRKWCGVMSVMGTTGSRMNRLAEGWKTGTTTLWRIRRGDWTPGWLWLHLLKRPISGPWPMTGSDPQTITVCTCVGYQSSSLIGQRGRHPRRSGISANFSPEYVAVLIGR